MKHQGVDISVVVPVYNEEESLPVLIPRLIRVLDGIRRPYEIIFVDDKSTDGSRDRLREFVVKSPSLRLLGLDRNCGLSTGLVAGMAEARGELIATIDSDLQMAPEDIPRLIDSLERNQVDMATGWRQKRQDTWIKRISSKIGNGVRNRLSQETVNDSACTLRVFKKSCIQHVPRFNGMHRFLPTLVKMEGHKVMEVPISHHPRLFGKSKYNIRNRMGRSFVDLLCVRWMKSRHIDYEIEERI